MTTGLVLGAGGALGWAFHLGVVDGVHEATGQDIADIARVIGTSAGGAVGAALLSGSSTAEVLELISTPPSEEDRARVEVIRNEAAASRLRRLRPAEPRLVLHARNAGLVQTIVGLMPAGRFPTTYMRRFAQDVPWPESLWIPSVRLDDGQTVIFGRDATPPTLADAVEATQAIPGMFQPKVIDGARFVDGAIASSTHADELLDGAIPGSPHSVPDLAVIAAPMIRPGRSPVRALAKLRMEREAKMLRRAGIPTVIVTPGEAVLNAAVGYPGSSPEAGRTIVDAARTQTVEAFARADDNAR